MDGIFVAFKLASMVCLQADWASLQADLDI